MALTAADRGTTSSIGQMIQEVFTPATDSSKEVPVTEELPEAQAAPVVKAKPAKKAPEEESTETEEATETDANTLYAKRDKEAKDYEKGMRKFQRERDEALRWKKDNEKLLEQFQAIQKTFKGKGVEGLVDLLSGEEGSWSKVQKNIEERAIKRFNSDASELELLDKEDQLLSERQARAAAEKEKDEYISSIKERELGAQRAEISSKLHTTFEAHRFDGKLGDEKQEARLNKFVWQSALEELSDWAKENGVEEHKIPAKVVKETFEAIANGLKSSQDRKAEELSKEKIAKKKASATQSAQLQSTGTKKASKKSIEQLAEDYTSSYNLNGFFKNVFGGPGKK